MKLKTKEMYILTTTKGTVHQVKMYPTKSEEIFVRYNLTED